MFRLIFTLLFAVMCFSPALQAQNDGGNKAWAFRYIASNYQYPLDNIDFIARDDFDGGIEFEYFHGFSDAFSLSFPLRLASAQLPRNATGTLTRQAFNIGLNALGNLHLYRGKVFRPRLYAGIGALLLETDDLSLDVPLGLGLDFYLGSTVSLSTTFGYHISDVDLRDHLKFGLGLNLAIDDYEEPEPEPVILDRDGDGINDDVDLCPDTPGLAAFNGCPDTDGDGITDGNDKCPTEAGPADNDGCPITDRDGDGIDDDDDDCPDVAGMEANNGCPLIPTIVVAKDKITDEVIPGVEVALVDNTGQIIKTGTTNALGLAEFTDVPPGDYTVRGKIYGADLQEERITTADFNDDDSVQKTVYFDDPNFIVQGKVFYCNSPRPLPSVTLNLQKKSDNFMKTTIAGSDGAFAFYLDDRTTYELYAKKESFLSQVVDLDVNDYDRNTSVFVRLEICAEEVECGTVIRLDNILYDLGSAAIRPDAMPDLNKVVRFLRDNKDAKIELSSHTDSRGGAGSNMALSDRRARSAADYIVSEGIARSRVIGKGYGETQLVNRCADGVSCSEAEHQENRRTEFKVICPE